MISLFVMCVIGFFLPASEDTGVDIAQHFFRQVVDFAAPVFSYNEEKIAEDARLFAGAAYENEQARNGTSGQEAQAADFGGTGDGSKDTKETETESGVSGNDNASGDGDDPSGGSASGDSAAYENKPAGSNGTTELPNADLAETETEPDDMSVQNGGEEVLSADEGGETGDIDSDINNWSDFDSLIQNYYIVDSSTTVANLDLDSAVLVSEDLTVDKDADGPQILIYHTHSEEAYVSSEESSGEATVVAVGERLTQILTERYGFRVLHHTGVYDAADRDHAYSNAAPAIAQLLAENPTIEVVIDLHRDSVPEDTRLTAAIDGKETAKIMFFNGLCRTASGGDLASLTNPYLQDNLAFSLQMQLAAESMYPDFTRKIYLKGYRYNMHFLPKSLLVEVGAQNNTIEEAQNAMEPLAALLADVLLAP